MELLGTGAILVALNVGLFVIDADVSRCGSELVALGNLKKNLIWGNTCLSVTIPWLVFINLPLVGIVGLTV